ncbi:hypothetical protein EGI22_14350 [Lacihabitans sp. LS3-19]|uniref:DoxX family protein n=1 Tax=Lacihabitans sp. LS3-19 TaxID=2487335 RepID=UPI0020CD47A6|nr:DoxX family protein [Lacihabitans sp. LS3-19]MCP9769096.1 hypothetical protein [Lacihabitans sp. LS3-19]
MTTTIWILKGLIGILFAFVGSNKMFLSKSKLLEKGMKGLIELNEKQIKVAGGLELLGAIGLILPSAFNYYPILSALSALCLGLTMVVAGLINLKLKLSIVPNIIIFIICIFIAYWEMK